MMLTYSWFFLRWPVLIFFLCFFVDFEISLFVVPIIFFHLKLGLKSIFIDYFYKKNIKIIFSLLIRIFIVELLLQTLELLL